MNCHICKEPTQLICDMYLHDNIEKDMICAQEYDPDQKPEYFEKLKLFLNTARILSSEQIEYLQTQDISHEEIIKTVLGWATKN